MLNYTLTAKDLKQQIWRISRSLGGLKSGGLESGGLEPRSTDLGSGFAVTCGFKVWGSRVWESRVWGSRLQPRIWDLEDLKSEIWKSGI